MDPRHPTTEFRRVTRNPLAGASCLDTIFVSHYIRVMRARRLRNITITLEESVARWARLEAARREVSVSSLLAAILKDHMHEQSGYDSALRRALARKPFLKTDGRYMTREEAHARPGVR
jgi:predicted DNA-binding ribbon-helix-helix protein